MAVFQTSNSLKLISRKIRNAEKFNNFQNCTHSVGKQEILLFNFFSRSETPISAMGEDSNHSVMSDSQDGTNFKINPASSGPKELSKE